MSESEKVPSGEPAGQVSDEAGENSNSDQSTSGGKDSVAYDTYRRVLGEKKKASEELSALRAELTVLKESKMQDEGRKDELIESLKKRLGDTESEHKKMLSNFVYNSITSKVKEEAIRAGCVDADKMIKLCDVAQLDVDEQFNTNGEQVKAMVEAFKKENPFFFNKPTPKVHDGVPATPNLNVGSNLKNLTIDQLARKLAELPPNKRG